MSTDLICAVSGLAMAQHFGNQRDLPSNFSPLSFDIVAEVLSQ